MQCFLDMLNNFPTPLLVHGGSGDLPIHSNGTFKWKMPFENYFSWRGPLKIYFSWRRVPELFFFFPISSGPTPRSLMVVPLAGLTNP